MYLVCKECMKVYVEGKWVNAVPPIDQVQYTVCDRCGGLSEGSSSHGMVYMDKQREQAKKK